MNSATLTRACFKMPRNVPIASSRWSGTVHPISPSAVDLLKIT